MTRCTGRSPRISAARSRPVNCRPAPSCRPSWNSGRSTTRRGIPSATPSSGSSPGGLVETRPGPGHIRRQKIVPFVTTLTGDPRGIGGEGDIYLNEVRAPLRAGDRSAPPRGRDPAGGQLTRGGTEADEGPTVVSRHQERHIDGTPWSLQTSFYPLSLVQRGATRLIDANDIQQGSVEYLRESAGIKQVGYRDTMKVRPPDATEARFFGLADDGRVSVIETRRTAFDETGAPSGSRSACTRRTGTSSPSTSGRCPTRSLPRPPRMASRPRPRPEKRTFRRGNQRLP